MTKQEIYEIAKGLGFCDLKAVPVYPEDIRPGSWKGRCLPQTALVLFWRYGPGKTEESGKIALSNYYPASNAAYWAARGIAKALRDKGIACLHTEALPLKQLALRSGGFIGKNSLYYHGDCGSFVVIQAILLENKLEMDIPEKASADMCRNCTLCEEACPTGAIGGDISRLCMRRRMGKNPPEEGVRNEIYQLLGCERCQEVCPHNQAKPLLPRVYSVEDILDRSALKEIKETAGANMARTNILLAQTIAYAANRGMREMIPHICELQKEPLLQEISLWALRKLGE